MELEKFGVNAYIFNKVPERNEKFVVEYPTRAKQGWYFWIFINDEHFELDLPKQDRYEIIGKVRALKPDNLWEDTTDWANVRCY